MVAEIFQFSRYAVGMWLRRICGGGCAGYVMVVVQDMWWWFCRICGCGCAGYVVGGLDSDNHTTSLPILKADICQIFSEAEISRWDRVCQ